jgi:hypothetical protein
MQVVIEKIIAVALISIVLSLSTGSLFDPVTDLFGLLMQGEPLCYFDLLLIRHLISARTPRKTSPAGLSALNGLSVPPVVHGPAWSQRPDWLCMRARQLHAVKVGDNDLGTVDMQRHQPPTPEGTDPQRVFIWRDRLQQVNAALMAHPCSCATNALYSKLFGIGVGHIGNLVTRDLSVMPTTDLRPSCYVS